jgi:hypothetical protein
MTFYDKFITSVQCEESQEVTPEEQEEVFQMMAEEHAEPKEFAGYEAWLDSLENGERAQIKDWQGSYSNDDSGPSYNGIAI